MFRKVCVFSGIAIFLLILSVSAFPALQSPTNTKTGNNEVSGFILQNFSDPSVKASITGSAGIQFDKTKEGIKLKEEGYLGSSQPKDTLKPAEIQALEALKKREIGGVLPPEFVFSENIRDGYAIRFGGKTIRMRHAQAKADATIEQSALVYKNAYRDTDVLYVFGGGGCQEMLVLRSKDAPSKFVYECKVDGGGEIGVNKKGELTAGGMTLSKPVIFDVAGKKIEGRYEKTSKGIVLAFNPDGLKYPVLIDPVWQTTDSMFWTYGGRMGHTATLLRDGKVILIGGHGHAGYKTSAWYGDAQIYDPLTASFNYLSSSNMAHKRAFHTATLLPDGNILIAGGYNEPEGWLSGAEIFYPGSGQYISVPDMHDKRAYHTATLLNDGTVLVTGGGSGEFATSGTMLTGTPDATLSDWTSVTSGSFTIEVDGTLYSVTGLDFNWVGDMDGVASVISSGLGSSATCTYDASANGGSGGFHFTSSTPGSLSTVSALGTSSEGTDISGNGSTYLNGASPSATVAGTYAIFYYMSNAEYYNPSSQTWNSVNPMHYPRQEHTATLMPDGSVLIVGGYDGSSFLTSGELYFSGSFSDKGDLTVGRAGHTATLLPGGYVWFDGGTNESGSLDSVEYYHDGSFGTVGYNMTAKRAYHTATLLPDGKVLLSGGFDGSYYLGSAELHDPYGGSCVATPSLNNARANHTATLLPDGSVLLAGGFAGGTDYLSKGECYVSTDVGTFAAASGTLSPGRRNHTATLLRDGTILIAGGFDGTNYLTSAELYNPADGSISATTGGLNQARAYHSATLMPDGRVIIAGGSNESGPLDSTEWYDPGASSFSPAPTMECKRARHTATLAGDGTVVFIGGFDGTTYLASAEEYYPSLDRFWPLPSMSTGRAGHAATLLRDTNYILVTGGQNEGGDLSSAELYNVSDGTFSGVSPMNYARKDHTATLLPNENVLIVGGSDIAEVYSQYGPLWTPHMSVSRTGHTATLLPNRNVLIAGGYDGANYLTSTELYNSAMNTFEATTVTLNTARSDHTATLLPDNTVVMIGGINGGGVINNAEYGRYTDYDYKNSNVLTAQPMIDTFGSSYLPFPCPIDVGSSTLHGSVFKGTSEASGGNGSANSPTNYPHVFLMRHDGLLLDCSSGVYYPDNWGSGNTSIGFSASSLPGGHYMLTVVTSGVPSDGKIVYYEPPPAFPAVPAPHIGGTKLNGNTIYPNVSNYISPSPEVTVRLTNEIGVKTVEAHVTGMSISQTVLCSLEAGGSVYDGTWKGLEKLASYANGNYTLTVYAYDVSGSMEAAFYNVKIGGRGAGVQVVGNLYNYPSPFKPSSGGTTQIQYTLSGDAPIILIIYDISGHEVKRFKYGSGTTGGSAGVNKVTWDGSSLSGKVVGSGMYLYKIISGDNVLGDGRIIVVK